MRTLLTLQQLTQVQTLLLSNYFGIHDKAIIKKREKFFISLVFSFALRYEKSLFAHAMAKGVISLRDKIKYGIIGALAGFANGFFGSGGGLFLVPLFTRWSGMEQRKAFATSVAVIFPLSILSVIIYFTKGAIDLQFAWPFLVGGMAGGFIAGKVFSKVPLTLLRRSFGVLLLYGGIRALFFR